MKFLVICLPILLIAAGCAQGPSARPSGTELLIRWAVVDNLDPAGPHSAVTLVNQSPHPLPASGWSLYFNFARMVPADSVDPEIRIEHVNGDLRRLSPAAGFQPLAAGAQRSFRFGTGFPVLNLSEGPAGWYLVFEGGEPEATGYEAEMIPTEQLRRGPADQLEPATPEFRFRRDAGLSLVPDDQLSPVVPTPVAYRKRSGAWTLDASTVVSFESGLVNEAEFLTEVLSPLLGSTLSRTEGAARESDNSVIRLEISPVEVGGRRRGAGSEAYRLRIDPRRGVLIQGTDQAGVFYGIQTLRALLPLAAWKSPQPSMRLDAWEIDDAPRFGYRGQHLDVARNFHSRESVEKLLDLMAFYKLNRFHFHLTDDEGWRLEIPGLPELVEVGSRRGHSENETDHLVPSFGSGPQPDNAPGSGHYSREDFIAILRLANARHIEVIPEIDVPGHARAAIKAMEARRRRLAGQGDQPAAGEFLLHEPEDRSTYQSVQGWTDNVINVCQDSSYRFLEKVVDEIQSMYREAGAPLALVHVGGDEVPSGVWEGSPSCRALMAEAGMADSRELWSYFLDRLAGILERRGLRLAGWEEVALTGSTHDAVSTKAPNPRFVGRGFTAWVWNSVWGWGGEEFAYRLANAGYEVILCNASNLYFDLADSKDPAEPGYYWAGFVSARQPWEFIPLDLYRGGEKDQLGRPLDPAQYRNAVRPSREGTSRILGLQAQLWSENAKSPELFEYAMTPKLVAFAERAWALSPLWAESTDPVVRGRLREAAWNVFANQVGRRELPRLDYFGGGWRYRVPPAGAVVAGEMLEANVEFPGLEIRYTLDGSEPTASSPPYTEPVSLDGGQARVAVFTQSGRAGRTVTLPE